jgi:hypothetical protein
MVDHRRHHAIETQKQTHLHGYKNDRENDPDDGGDKSQPIVKQVSPGKLKNQGHDLYAGNRGKTPGSRFVIAGLVPAISIGGRGALIIGIAGRSPAMTK